MENIKVDVLASIQDIEIREDIEKFANRVKERGMLLRDIDFLVTSKVNNQRAFFASSDMIEFYWKHLKIVTLYLSGDGIPAGSLLELAVSVINSPTLPKEVVPLYELMRIVRMDDIQLNKALKTASEAMLVMASNAASIYLT